MTFAKPMELFVGRVEGVDLPGLGLLAAESVRRLPPGLTFGVVGTLGAGKTRFTQEIGATLGIDAAEITSPTFTLLHTYATAPASAEPSAGLPARLHHLDAYRLSGEDEFLDLGVEELFEESDAWVLVEWADRVAGAMPAETVWVWIEFDQRDDRRRIEWFTAHPVARIALARLADDWSQLARDHAS